MNKGEYPEHDKLSAPGGNGHLWEIDLGHPAEPKEQGGVRRWTVSDESNYVIGPFLDWLMSKAVLAEWRVKCGRCDWLSSEDAEYCENPECGAPARSLGPPRLWPHPRRLQGWLEEYYGIDGQKLSEEKDQMLSALRAHS